MLSAKRLVAVALALVLAGALWVRFGYEPDSGSHRITIEHVDAADGDFASIDVAIEPVDGALVGPPGAAAARLGRRSVSALRGRRQTLSP